MTCAGSRRPARADGRCGVCGGLAGLCQDGTVRAHRARTGRADEQESARPGEWHECPRCHARMLVFAREAAVWHPCPADPEHLKRLTMFKRAKPTEEALRRLVRRSA